MIIPTVQIHQELICGGTQFASAVPGRVAAVCKPRPACGGSGGSDRDRSVVKAGVRAIATIWLLVGAIVLILGLRPAFAETCDPLLVVIGGLGDDPNAEKLFKLMASSNDVPPEVWDLLMQPVMYSVVEFIEPIYKKHGIKMIYYKHKLGQLDVVLDRAKGRVETYRRRCQFASIGLVGFSWGGDAVYRLAYMVDTEIQALVTLDPVSISLGKRGLRPFICATQQFPLSVLCQAIVVLTAENPKPKNVKTWIHVWTPGNWDASDALAILGGAWLDQEYADISIRMTGTPHEAVCMMYKQAETRLLSELADDGVWACESRTESVACMVSEAWACR